MDIRGQFGSAPNDAPACSQPAPNDFGSKNGDRCDAPKLAPPYTGSKGASTPAATTLHHPGILHTSPARSICPHCRAPVWYAVISGCDTRLDPNPVDIPAEVIHRVAGRMTYQDAPGRTLAQRWPERIRYGQPTFVLAEHHCTPPPHPPLTPLWPEPARPADTEEPPF